MINAHRVARGFSIALLALFALVYLGAKFDFFTHYDPNRVGWYVRHHSKYWVAMLIVAFFLWITDRLFPENRR